jgi:hypothetical protein
MSPDAVKLMHYGAAEAGRLLDELCDAYANAYGVEADGEKVPAFRDRATKALERPRYELVAAHVDDDQLAGFAFGYSLPPDTFWWDGLQPEPPESFTVETGERTFVLAEIEVRRRWQGSGVGRALNDAILAGRQDERATRGLSCHVARWLMVQSTYVTRSTS